MSTYTYQGTLKVISCGGCGIRFGLDQGHYELLLRDKSAFFCPNGCQRWFTSKTEAQRERERAERAEVDLQLARAQVERTKRSRNAIRGVLTRTKRRLHAGVCPCCRRNFSKLGEHMRKQHPDYLKEPLE